MSQIVITGANRGIGLELARQYLAKGHQVLAACRHSSTELEASGAEIYRGLEVTSDDSVQSFKKYLDARPIDILINNAGILRTEGLEELDFSSIREQFEVNALGPLRVTRGLLSNLVSGSKVVMITSRMGSLGDNGSGHYDGYRMSKAALNMASINLARELGPLGIGVYIVHPGMVATEMTGRQGISPSHAAGMIANRIEGFTLSKAGRFWHANGEELPW